MKKEGYGLAECCENSASEQQKDKEILNIIDIIINKGVEDTRYIIQKFEEIYRDEYRHKYSQILNFLMKVEAESLDYLASNMDILKEDISKGTYEFKKSFLKLYDHVMLEIVRIRLYNNYSERENLIEDKLNTAKNEFEYHSNVWNNLQAEVYTNIGKVNEQFKNSNAQFISILGVFSAVVMVFFGGQNIIGNILSTINKCSIMKVVFLASLVGLMMFNIIFLLLYFISKIVDKSIATRDLERLWDECFYWDETENIKAKEKYKKVLNSPIRRLKIRYPIVFWYNFFMILTMISSIVIWIIKMYF